MGKHLPNSCHFWKKCNGYRQNIYILSHGRHCWTLWCLFFISVEWKMKTPERKTKQVPSALLQKFRLQKFRLKINCKSYIWNKTITWKPTIFPTFLCINCLCEVKDVGSKSSWREFFLQFFQLLYTVAMMSRSLAHAIHTHYKIRRWPKNP